MRILKVEPGKAPYEKEMANSLDAIQAEVEGLFEPIYMGDGTILCCNDEGKINGMEMNRRLEDDIICGPFFIVGDGVDGEFRSLTDEEVQRYSEQFAQIEQFADYEPDAQPRMTFFGW